jgi:hypothetical protein
LLQYGASNLYNQTSMTHAAVDGRTGCSKVRYSGDCRLSIRALATFPYASLVLLATLSDSYEKSEAAA